MIKIYPSPFSNPEEHEALYQAPVMPGETLLACVKRLVPTYDPNAPTPWECRVNGMPVPPSAYPQAILGPDTQVHFFLTPRGGLVGDLVNAVLNIFTLGAWSLVSKFMTPKVAKTGGTGSASRDRDDMDMAAIKANTVKQGAVVREKFGSGRIYPDHLVQLRRYFVDGEPTRQACEMFMSVGIGKFLIDPARGKVGETTQAALGVNFLTRIYGPGEDVSGEPMADNWFTSAEVGGTSSGTAGLDMVMTGAAQQNAEVSTVVVGGNTVTVPAGAGSWPATWAPGMVVRALVPYAWEVLSPSGGGRNRVRGPWASVRPAAGMSLEVAGDFPGMFTVEAVTLDGGGAVDYVTLNYPNGSPVTDLPAGNANLAVGYSGLRFRIQTLTAQVMTLTRLTDTGAEDPTWPGYVSQSSVTSRFSLDANNTEAGWSGPMAACPEGEVSSAIEVDFFYPGGLYVTNQFGNAQAYQVTVEVQYRDIATAGAWTSVRYTHTGSKIEQIGFTHRIEQGTVYRPEVRCRRITPAGTGTISDKTQWYGLKSRLLTRPNRYDGITTAAARVFGGGALAAQAEQMVSYWGTRILPYRQNGQWMPEAPTRSIVAACLYIARNRGYGEDRIDLAEWDRLGAIWDARQDYFDGSFEKETTAEAAMNVVLRAGYANLTAPRGVLRPARDALRSEAEKSIARLYSPQNSSAILRSGQPVSPNDADGVDVKWMNPNTWTLETVKCRLPGIPNPRKITTMTAEGINDRTRAWRLGMRELLAARFRRWKMTWATGLDSFASSYMDYVELMDNVPELPSGGHLRYWDGARLFRSNEPLAPDATVAVLRRPDGTKFGPFPITRQDDYWFTMDQPLDFTPVDESSGDRMPTHVFTGTVSEQFWPCLVVSVAPNGSFRANVEALGYDERVYQFDDAEPPPDA